MAARFEDIPAKLSGRPDLAHELGVFADFWGLDCYTPPEHVAASVRQIVILALQAAQKVEAD